MRHHLRRKKISLFNDLINSQVSELFALICFLGGAYLGWELRNDFITNNQRKGNKNAR